MIALSELLTSCVSRLIDWSISVESDAGFYAVVCVECIVCVVCVPSI